MGNKQWRLIVAVGVLLLTAEAGAQQAVRWQPTLESAKRLAGQTNRLVLVHFWAPWCEACRRMDRDVFGQAEVAAAIKAGYVPVKLNADHFPATAQQYSVKALPTQVVITPQGQLVEKFQGALGYSQYIAQLQRIAANNHGQPTRPDTRMASAPPTAPGLGSSPSGPANRQQPGTAPYSDDRYANYYNGSRGQTAPVGPRYGQPPQTQSPQAQPPQTQPPQTQPGMAANPGPSRYGTERPGADSQPQRSAFSNARPQGNTPIQPTQSAPARQIQPPPGVTPGMATSRPPQAYAGMAAAGGQSGPAAGASSGNPPLGLDGYCPVELTDSQRWQLGDRRWGAIHRGRTYLFTGSTQRDRFLADPDHYSPIMAGNDVVLSLDQGQSAAGRREHGVFFGGRVYLFSSESSLEMFSKDPNRYANGVLQSMRTAPRQSYR